MPRPQRRRKCARRIPACVRRWYGWMKHAPHRPCSRVRGLCRARPYSNKTSLYSSRPCRLPGRCKGPDPSIDHKPHKDRSPCKRYKNRSLCKAGSFRCINRSPFPRSSLCRQCRPPRRTLAQGAARCARLRAATSFLASGKFRRLCPRHRRQLCRFPAPHLCSQTPCRCARCRPCNRKPSRPCRGLRP